MHANTELTGMIQISVEVSKVSHQLQIERGLTAGYMTDRSQNTKEAIDNQRLNSDDAINNFFNFVKITEIGQQMMSMHSYADEIENHVTELRNALSIFKLNKQL